MMRFALQFCRAYEVLARSWVALVAGLLLAMVLFPERLMAGDNTWTTGGPAGLDGGLNVVALAVDPQHPKTVYAGTWGGVFKTADGGTTWTEIDAGLPDKAVRWLTLDPAHPLTVYVSVGTGYGAPYRSDDGGVTWAPWALNPRNCWAKWMVPSPTTPDVFYAACSTQALLRTSDSGLNWTAVENGMAPWSLAIDPSDDHTLYLGAVLQGLYKSTDRGDHWEAVNTGLPNYADINAIAVDPQNPNTVYAGTAGVWKSLDGGATWASASNGLPTGSDAVAPLVIDPAHPSTIYAGTWYGVYKSTDGGDHWAQLTNRMPDCLVTDSQNPLTLYEGCPNGNVYSYTECPHVTFSPDTLPVGSVGVPYSQTLTANGGTEPYTFLVASGALPAGLALSSAGVLSGAPTASGPATFGITAADTMGCGGSRTYSLTVVNPPAVSLIKKSSPPFKLVATGSNLQSGIKVFIDGTEWTSVVWKNVGKIQLTGGASLKAAVPKGTTHAYRFLNPDGGEASLTWGW